MKKIILVMIFAFAFIGCNSGGNSSRDATATPVEPDLPVYVPPVYVPPVVPDDNIPDVGTGSVKYTPSCTSGFATVTYVFQSDSSIDPNSFIIVHLVNGVSEAISQGSVNGNGSISTMRENIFVQRNTTDVQIAHQVQVKFITDGVSQVDNFSFLQPSCNIVVVPVDPPDLTDPVDPTDPDPVEPVEPDPEPTGPSEPYAPNTAYDVGDVITIVDGVGVTRTYVCNTAYVSGFQGTWLRFRNQEQGNWTRIANLVTMSVDIS